MCLNANHAEMSGLPQQNAAIQCDPIFLEKKNL
jgi:hypothetical protein